MTGIRSLLGCALLACAATAFGTEAGETAPDFTLQPLRSEDGSAAISLANFRGKVVYVDFWASWCPPCLVSIPLLNELRNEYVNAGKPFEVLAVNAADDVGLRERQEFVVALNVDGPVLEPLAPVSGLVGTVALDGRTHGAIDDQDALG